MKTQLVIKGAYYYDNESDTILVPHFTGEFIIVDCTQYKKASDLKGVYDKQFLIENKENYVMYEGSKYFYAEYSPNNISDEWFLLSDLSNLFFEEQERSF